MGTMVVPLGLMTIVKRKSKDNYKQREIYLHMRLKFEGIHT
jgi:hypothetical protein